MALRPKLLDADNPGDSHFEQSMSEIMQSMDAREGRGYSQAIASLVSIINIGYHSPASFAIAQQVATVFCEFAPQKFSMAKIEADVHMLFKIQNAEILRNPNGPTST